LHVERKLCLRAESLSRHREPPPGGVAIQGRKHRAAPRIASSPSGSS
jgi:hypothetical protein